MRGTGLLSRGGRHRRPIALLTVFLMIFNFIPVLPAYAVDEQPPFMEVQVDPFLVTGSQDVTITVTSEADLVGESPLVVLALPNSDTETVGGMAPAGPNSWIGHYSINEMSQEGTYTVTAEGFNGSYPDSDEAIFKVDFSGGEPGPGSGPDPDPEGGAIEGQVFGTTGPPGLSGCNVNLYNEDPKAPPIDWSNTDNETNTYKFDGLEPGVYWVEALPGDDLPNLAASERVQVVVESTETVSQNLTLRVPSIRGVVVNPDGVTPVEGARVEARTQDWTQHVEDFTDSQGRFALPPVSPGEFIVAAYPPEGSGFASSAPRKTSLAEGNKAVSLPGGSLVLRNPMINGCVVDPDGVEGISYAGVNIHNQNWTVVENAMTDEDGYFYMGQMAEGTYTVEAYPGPESEYSQSSPKKVYITGDAQDLEIRLTSPSITGTVYNPDGETPATSGFVNVHNSNWTMNVGSGIGPDGSFRIGGLPPGVYKIEAMPDQNSQFSQSSSMDIEITEGEILPPITLQFTQPLIVGWIVDGNGNAVSNANVNLHTPDWQRAYFTQPTGADGRFAIGGIEDTGTYQLEINPPWDKPYLMRPDPLTLEVGEDTYTVTGGVYESVTVDEETGIEIAFTKAEKNITGNVTKSGDLPVTNARVVAFKERGGGFAMSETDEAGEYNLMVSGGQWMVMVEPNYESEDAIDWAYSGQPRRVSLDDTATAVVDFQVVSANATVIGKIVAPDGVTPVNNAHIEVRNKTGQGNSGHPNEEGNFSVNVPAGTYQVMVFVGPESQHGSPLPVAVTVADGQTKNVGTLKLVGKSSQIKGIVADLSGTGISGAKVNAWQMGGGFTQATTGSDGTFTLNVSAGNWEVMLEPTKSASYVYSGPPKRVTVRENETKIGVTFDVVYADATIKGCVVDGSGDIMTDIYGFASAFGEESGYGGPLEGGRFEIKVPAGTYDVSGGLPPEVPYMLSAETDVVVGSGETKTVKLTVVENDMNITGTLLDQSGQPITDDNLFVEIFAINDSGSVQHTLAEKDDESGQWTYELNVTDGNWRIGYFADPESGYIGRPPMGDDSAINVGETDVEYDITLNKASATISGQVTDPEGNGVPYAFVFAEEKGAEGGARNKFFADTKTDADGNYTLAVPAGSYRVGTGLPPSRMASEQWMYPMMVEVTVADEGTENVDLQFESAQAVITGTTEINDTGVTARVHAWSDNGGYAETKASDDGSYTLNVKGDDTWHVRASYDDEDGFYESSETEVTLGLIDEETVPLVLVAADLVPGAVTATFSATEMKIIELSNGTKIQIPAGALGTSGNVTVVAKPILGLRTQKDAVPFGIGYELSAMDADGQEITSFKSSVTITFPYDPDSLPEGMSEEDIVPAYWDDISGTWKKADSAVVDTANHTVMIMVSHFSEWANVAKSAASVEDPAPEDPDPDDPPSGGGGGGDSDTMAPNKPAGLAATAGQGQIVISWSANSETDLNGYNLYRSATEDVTKAEKVTTLAKDITEYTDANVTVGTAYYYWLSASDETGNESAKAGSVSAMVAAQVTLIDVDAKHWAFSFIQKLITKKVINGYGDGSFRPNAKLSRAEFAKMVCVAMGWELVDTATPSFSDVSKDHWAYKYIETAKAHGVLNGYNNGTFRPGQHVSRAEIAKVIAKALNLASGTSTLKDVASSWAKDAINACVKAGIINGYKDNTFKPVNNATRAEAAKLIISLLK